MNYLQEAVCICGRKEGHEPSCLVPENERLKARILELESLFQAAHGVHFSWVAEGVRLKARVAELETKLAACARAGCPAAGSDPSVSPTPVWIRDPKGSGMVEKVAACPPVPRDNTPGARGPASADGPFILRPRSLTGAELAEKHGFKPHAASGASQVVGYGDGFDRNAEHNEALMDHMDRVSSEACPSCQGTGKNVEPGSFPGEYRGEPCVRGCRASNEATDPIYVRDPSGSGMLARIDVPRTSEAPPTCAECGAAEAPYVEGGWRDAIEACAKALDDYEEALDKIDGDAEATAMAKAALNCAELVRRAGRRSETAKDKP